MIQSQNNDLSGQSNALPPFAKWPNLTYGARMLPDAFVIDFRFDTTAYFINAGKDEPPIDMEKAGNDLYIYSDAENSLSRGPRLLLVVPDVVAWDSAHHILPFTRAVLDAFYTMLNDGILPEPITKSISLPTAALSGQLKGLRPLALYLWSRRWRPDDMGSRPSKGNPDFEIPFEALPDDELKALAAIHETKTPQVKIGYSENNGQKTLWLVPFLAAESGCSLRGPAFFGLRPLSGTLQSRSDVAVRQYVSGQSIWSQQTVISKRSVKDVDINALAGSFVDALDRHPSEAVAAARQSIAVQRARQELATLFTDTGHEALLQQAQWWLQLWLEEKSGLANKLLAVLAGEFNGVEAPKDIVLLVEAVPADVKHLAVLSQGYLNFQEHKALFVAACTTDATNRADYQTLPLECGFRITGAKHPYYGEGDIHLYHPVTLATESGSLLKTNVPNLLQTLPTPAIILNQQALASQGGIAADASEKLRQSRLWDYQVAYDRQSAVQDTLLVRLNTGKTGTSALNAPSKPDLLDALVEFTEVYTQLRTDLEQEDVIPEARESFEGLALEIANIWMYRNPMMGLAQQVDYRITEIAGKDGALEIAITGAEENGLPQLLPHYEGYTAEKIGENWRFCANTSQRYLLFDDRNWHLRSLVFGKFDVLYVENPRAELALERNLLPVDGKMLNPDFAFRTGFMGLEAAASPFLTADVPIDISGFGKTLTEQIEGFFTGLLKGTNGRSLRLSVLYGYEAVAGTGMPVTVPVLLLPKEAYTKELAARVANAIHEWKQQQLSGDPESGAFFELDLTVFGMLEQRGVLRVKGCTSANVG